MREGMATHRPATVQISASAMPPESARGSPMPPAWMTLKERMMPVTVPSRPSSGDTPAIVPSVLRKRSSSCTTWRPVSSRRSIRNSRGRWRLASPVARSLPRGEFCSSASISLSLIWFASISRHTRSGSACGSTRLSCRVHRRSSTMAAPVIEHRMIGHISGPPARTISHILGDPWQLRAAKAASYRRGAAAQGSTGAAARRTSPPRAFWYSPRLDATPAAEKTLPRPAHAARALVSAAIRRAAHRPAAVDAASARRGARLRSGTGDLLRTPAGAPDPGDHRRGHLAPQHSGDLRHHLAAQSLHRGTRVLPRLPGGRGAAARAAAAFQVRAQLALVGPQPRAGVAAVHRRLYHLRAARRHRRLAVARPVVALAGDQPLPHPPRHPGGLSLTTSHARLSGTRAERTALELVDTLHARGEPQVMRHHHEARAALAIELQHQRQHAVGVAAVQIAGRLIGH